MSDVWRIFVVEGDESLNRNIVNSLRKDGYDVQGVLSGADAVRVLWSEEYDVVICDLKAPRAEGIELLQWLRAYRPNTHIILVGGASGEANDMRMQALESGAASYLEKPLDLHLLKEELRRLLQQTGFSANLDSFDLLDVIQIITMSRKSIALLVNTGLEERGILRFKNGELIWAEYGILRGEEAFFALAAHKNGTVIHQPWNDQITSNVTQPLSRLIFQALQYRSKYANKQQFTGEQEAIAPQVSSPLLTEEIDDRPFAFLADLEGTMQTSNAQEWGMHANEQYNENSKEWWEKTGSIPEIKRSAPAVTHQLNDSASIPGFSRNGHGLESELMSSTGPHKPLAEQGVELPSWLTEQPTASNMTALPPTAVSPGFPAIPVTPLSPLSPTSSSEWQMPGDLLYNPAPGGSDRDEPTNSSSSVSSIRRSSPIWQMPEKEQSPADQNGSLPGNQSNGRASAMLGFQEQVSQPLQVVSPQRQVRRNYNYASLVAALQTLGYAIPGFEAAAVVSMEGQPIAQVSIDDQDLSQLCGQHCVLLKSALQMQEANEGDLFEDLLIQSNRKRTLLRVVGSDRNAFLTLITSKDADLSVSREIVINIDGAISAALRG